MSTSTVNCTKCDTPIPWETLDASKATVCPDCGVPLHFDIFPALLTPPARGEPGEVLLQDDLSSCFYHPQKTAVIHCHHCGRFLCALCDIELGGRHLCPACLETGKEKGKLKNLQNHRVLYDEIALTLAILPILICYITVVTAPVAIFIALRYWRAPSSIVPRTKVRFVAAIGIAGLQIVGWTVFLVGLLGG
jgi:hypothetical protein